MQIIPPAELFRPWYTFSTEQGGSLSNFSHYVLVVVDQSAVNGLFIDETPINQFAVSWTNFAAPSSNIVGGAILVNSGVHIIRQQDGVPFGAYVYGYSTTSRCKYAYPAGLCLRTPGNQVGLSTHCVRNCYPFDLYSQVTAGVKVLSLDASLTQAAIISKFVK